MELYSQKTKPELNKAVKIFEKSKVGDKSSSISKQKEVLPNLHDIPVPAEVLSQLHIFKSSLLKLDTPLGELEAELVATEAGYQLIRHNRLLLSKIRNPNNDEFEIIGQGVEGNVYIFTDSKSGQKLVLKQVFPIHDDNKDLDFLTPQNDQLKVMYLLSRHPSFQALGLKVNVPLMASTFQSVSEFIPNIVNRENYYESRIMNAAGKGMLVDKTTRLRELKTELNAMHIDSLTQSILIKALDNEIDKPLDNNFFEAFHNYFGKLRINTTKVVNSIFNSIPGNSKEARFKVMGAETSHNIHICLDQLASLYQAYQNSGETVAKFFNNNLNYESIQKCFILIEGGVSITRINHQESDFYVEPLNLADSNDAPNYELW
ncbi:MAG: hypothetical protein OHK0017_11690 [Patescibacteria group bacterium]